MYSICPAKSQTEIFPFARLKDSTSTPIVLLMIFVFCKDINVKHKPFYEPRKISEERECVCEGEITREHERVRVVWAGERGQVEGRESKGG